MVRGGAEWCGVVRGGARLTLSRAQRQYDPASFAGDVVRYPFDDHNPCPFDLIAPFVQGVIVVPWCAAIALGWHHWHIPKLHGQLSGLIAFIRAIHQ